MPRKLEVLHVYDDDLELMDISHIDKGLYLINGEEWTISKMDQDQFGIYQEYRRPITSVKESDVNPQIRSTLIELQTALIKSQYNNKVYQEYIKVFTEIIEALNELANAERDNDPTRIQAANIRMELLEKKLPTLPTEFESH